MRIGTRNTWLLAGDAYALAIQRVRVGAVVADPLARTSLNLASINLACGPVATASVANASSWGVIEVYSPESDEMYGVTVPYSGVVRISNLATNLRSGIPQR